MKAPVSPTAVFTEFNSAFPEMAVGPNDSPKGAGERARRRDRAVRDAYRRINRQGWENVTIVNLNAFKLDLNMGYLGHLTVPAKKQGELYAVLTITQPRFDMKDNGDDIFEPIAVVPKEMAEDLISHYKNRDDENDTGEEWLTGKGVFFYMGTGPVLPENQDLFDEALRHQIDWFYQLVKDGQSNWAQTKSPRHVSDRMREAAKELHKLKLINVLPEWVTTTKADSPDGPCEGCGQTIAKVAKFCPHCSTIYDEEWVKVRRPDLWRRQQAGLSATASSAGASDAPDIDELIKEEDMQ